MSNRSTTTSKALNSTGKMTGTVATTTMSCFTRKNGATHRHTPTEPAYTQTTVGVMTRPTTVFVTTTKNGEENGVIGAFNHGMTACGTRWTKVGITSR